MMTMELSGCDINKPFILDGEDQDQLQAGSPSLSKKNWLLAILVRVIRPDRSLAMVTPVDLDRLYCLSRSKSISQNTRRRCRTWMST
jgi:hypothetical protein